MIINWTRINNFFFITAIVYSCISTPNLLKNGEKRALGYRIEGKEVVFEFDVRDYQKASMDGTHNQLEFAHLNIEQVAVSGEFNEWSKEGWKMTQVEEHIYQLRKKLKEFDSKIEWQYKFVVNEKYWIEPPVEASNRVPVSNWDAKRHNFVLNLTQPKLIGNTTFFLKGHPNAKRIYLAGNFNKWQPKEILMEKEENGWICRIDLEDGKYLYKFIVDDVWIEDPNNPLMEPNEYGGFNSVLLKGGNAVVFRLEAFQNARKVFLAADFNGWSTHTAPCTREGNAWVYRTSLPPGKYYYKYVVDGQWHLDPKNYLQEGDGRGNTNSVRYID